MIIDDDNLAWIKNPYHDHMVELKFKNLDRDNPDPSFATQGSACFDLRVSFRDNTEIQTFPRTMEVYPENKSLYITPSTRYLIPTGLILNIPEGYHVQVNIRSGTALKQGLELVNATGIIDSDYTKEIFLIVRNTSSFNVVLNQGDRIAQARLVKNIPTSLVKTDYIPEQKTDRVGGFNSTGVN
jgi:dUTP pyrophosphatase